MWFLVFCNLKAAMMPGRRTAAFEDDPQRRLEAYRKEYAVSLADVLLRRVPVALGPCWSESCSREAALRSGAVMGWKDQDLGANLEAVEMERSAVLHRPSRRGAALEAAAD